MKKGKEKGMKKEVRGLWTDIVASPYFSFGIDCEITNKYAEGLFEIYNKVFRVVCTLCMMTTDCMYCLSFNVCNASTTQHSTTQHSTVQHSRARREQCSCLFNETVLIFEDITNNISNNIRMFSRTLDQSSIGIIQ